MLRTVYCIFVGQYTLNFRRNTLSAVLMSLPELLVLAFKMAHLLAATFRSPMQYSDPLLFLDKSHNFKFNICLHTGWSVKHAMQTHLNFKHDARPTYTSAAIPTRECTWHTHWPSSRQAVKNASAATASSLKLGLLQVLLQLLLTYSSGYFQYYY